MCLQGKGGVFFFHHHGSELKIALNKQVIVEGKHTIIHQTAAPCMYANAVLNWLNNYLNAVWLSCLCTVCGARGWEGCYWWRGVGGGGSTGALCQGFEWFVARRAIRGQFSWRSNWTRQQVGDVWVRFTPLSVEISVCVCVLTFVGKSWNMVMPCLPNNRGGGLPHSVMLSFEISAILVDISCLRLTPVSLSEEIWGPQDVNFCLEWSGEVECLCVRVCVCFVKGGGGSLNTSGAQGFVGGVCLFSVSCSFNLISLHSFSFFVRIISSSLSLPPSACCDL